MITPGQASRIACWISLLTLTSQDGRCRLSGACWRRWMCMTDAPASKAALASRAICSGVTGTLCCFGSVSTPFSAQVMTALSLMNGPSISSGFCPERSRGSCVRRQPASCVNPLFAAVDRKIAGAGENRARLHSVEAADRVAEVSGVGIADVLREMGKVDVLVGEMQQMPRALPGPERAERDSGLFLEQMEEARWRQPRFCGAACRRHRLAGKSSDLRNRAHHPWIETALWQCFAKTHDVEIGAGDLVAMTWLLQLRISGANARGKGLAFGSRQAF